MLSFFIFVSSSLLSVIFLFAASAVLRLALGDTEQQETLAAKEGVCLHSVHIRSQKEVISSG